MKRCLENALLFIFSLTLLTPPPSNCVCLMRPYWVSSLLFTERIASAISTCLFKQRLSLVDFMIASLVICEVRPRSKPVEGSFTILQCKFGVRGQLNFLIYLIGV